MNQKELKEFFEAYKWPIAFVAAVAIVAITVVAIVLILRPAPAAPLSAPATAPAAATATSPAPSATPSSPTPTRRATVTAAPTATLASPALSTAPTNVPLPWLKDRPFDGWVTGYYKTVGTDQKTVARVHLACPGQICKFGLLDNQTVANWLATNVSQFDFEEIVGGGRVIEVRATFSDGQYLDKKIILEAQP